MNVLVLDEDGDFRSRLVGEMDRLGLEPVAFDAWSAALDHLDSGAPVELIITQLELPHPSPNGVSFARLARSRRPGVKLLFVSATREAAQWVDPRLGLVMLKSDGPEKIAEIIQAHGPAPEARTDAQAAGGSFGGGGEPTFL